MRAFYAETALVVLLLATAVLYAGRYVDFGLPPAEDAAILMRYARHLAAGEGIVWNIGEPPVDGATDFLFVVIVAAFHRLGFSLEHAVLVPTLAAHCATVALVCLALRAQGAALFTAGATALYVALGPGLLISAAYFGATVFAFVVALAWVLGQRIVLAGHWQWHDCFYFALTALLAALLRPEGTIMAALMTLGLCVALPVHVAVRLVLAVAVVFATLGGAYLIWRWEYFGQLLPNPFYRRGNRRFDQHDWMMAVRRAAHLCWPFVLAAAPALLSAKRWRLALSFAIPALGFTTAWGFFSNEMDFARRYQYALMPIAAVSWYPLVRSLARERISWDRLRQRPWTRFGIASAAVGVVAGLLLWQHAESQKIRRVRDGNHAIALLLQRYADRGYALATTEAGLLPLYSQWRTLDTFGLNDTAIAHRGHLADDDLERYSPAVVMWHDYGSVAQPPAPNRSGVWFDMIATLQRYVDRRGFVLAANFGIDPKDTHYYWVDADLRECEELLAAIRAVPYTWPLNGARARDFAAGRPGRGCRAR